MNKKIKVKVYFYLTKFIMNRKRMVVMEMVSSINNMVNTNEFYPNPENQHSLASGNVKVDDLGNIVVVSKDFILNLLSLAIGSSLLDNNLGRSVDVKV